MVRHGGPSAAPGRRSGDRTAARRDGVRPGPGRRDARSVGGTRSGTSWRAVDEQDDGGAGWADLGFTTATDGVVIHGPADSDGNTTERPGQLFLTSDAGRPGIRSPSDPGHRAQSGRQLLGAERRPHHRIDPVQGEQGRDA